MADRAQVLSGTWLRAGGLAAIAGGLTEAFFELLGFVSHGPTGYDLKILVFGMLNSDYQRLQILSGAFILLAAAVLYEFWKPALDRAGLIAFFSLIAGYLLALIAQILDYLAFPNPHPAFGIGFFLSLFLVIPLLLIGWLLLGISSVRMGARPRWSAYLPFLVSSSLGFAVLLVILEVAGVSIELPITGGLLVATVAGAAWISFGCLMLRGAQDLQPDWPG